MINKNALFTFMGLTFGITILMACAARWMGLTLFDAPLYSSQLVIAAAMFVPALSAIFTQTVVLKRPLKDLGFKWGKASDYLKVYAVILLMFVLNYAITWAFIQQPDLTLSAFLEQYGITSGLPMPATVMIAALTLMTLIGAPIMNMIPSLGEELGWRGFLLPALEPLGQVKAALFSGMIWALWHTPLILIMGFGYGREAFPGVLLHFVLVSSLGFWMGYFWFKTRSTILAAFMHAFFNANAYGVWSVIFINPSKLVVGPIGILNTALFLCLALITFYVMRSRPGKQFSD